MDKLTSQELNLDLHTAICLRVTINNWSAEEANSLELLIDSLATRLGDETLTASEMLAILQAKYNVTKH